MATSRQLIELVYTVITDSNLSRLLPVLDERVVLHVPEYLPFGGEYKGRSGFLSMMAKAYELWDNLRIHSLVHYMPDGQSTPDTIITMGIIEGKLLHDDTDLSLPFIHYWQLKDEKIVLLRAFNWNSPASLSRPQQERKGPGLSPNGHDQ